MALFKCTNCAYVTNRNYSLKLHTNRDNKCNPKFTKDNEVKKNKVKKNKVIECTETIPTTTKSAVKEHICLKCSKVLSCEQTLIIHQRISCKAGRNSLQCSSCKRIFKSRQSLAYHHKKIKCETTVETVKIQNIECSTCKKIFSNRQSIDNHHKNNECDPKTIVDIEIINLNKIREELLQENERLKIEYQTKTVIKRHVEIYPTIESGNKLEGSIYLLIEREFRKTEEKVYKIGKTKCLSNRMKDYPTGSQLLYCRICTFLNISECDLLKRFRKKFKQRIDIGREYFEGDCCEMIRDIENYFYNQE
jgi:hypothetical protein